MFFTLQKYSYNRILTKKCPSLELNSPSLGHFLAPYHTAHYLCIVNQNTTTMDKFKKIDIEFCLTDDSVNVYGYRLLTSGLQLDRFAPAIGFLMHNREDGVAVKWEDFRTETGCLFAKPVINTVRFPDLADQIENGFYNAASVGHIVALEICEDPKTYLEGQTGPTVTKWFPRECSIVDIPGNYSAIAKLYDERDNILHDLSDNLTTIPTKPKQKKSMEKINLTPEQIQMLNLTDTTPSAVTLAISDLVGRSQLLDKKEQELADLRAEMSRQKIESIIEKGLADRRITNALADKLRKTFADRPDSLADLIASMPVQSLVTDKIDKLADIPERFRGKSFEELFEAGLLEEVRTNYPDLYNQLKPQN